MSSRITPEMAARYYSNGVLDMPIPEECNETYIASFQLGFSSNGSAEGLFNLLLINGSKAAYDDGKAARAYIDKLPK